METIKLEVYITGQEKNILIKLSLVLLMASYTKKNDERLK